LKIMENSEKLLSLTNDIYDSVYENKDSIQDKLGEIRNKLSELSKIDKLFDERLSDCESALSLLNEISLFVRSSSFATAELMPETIYYNGRYRTGEEPQSERLEVVFL